MRVLDVIRGDLTTRRNLDIYTSVAVAVAAAVLSTFDVLPPEKTTSVLMLILAVIAFNGLVTRGIAERSAETNSDRFLAGFPESLVGKRAKASSLMLVGVSLDRTIETSFGDLDKALKAGQKLRVILTDPRADNAAIDARCHATRPRIDDIRVEIKRSLASLSKLKVDSGGDIEVRLTDVAMKFGVNYFEPDGPRAEMHVQLYGYRLAGESRPLFWVTPRDDEWFECYASQVETLWNDSKPYDLVKGEFGD